MQFLKTLLLFGFCLFASAANSISLSQEDPPPPQLVFLYTLYADCAKAIDVGNGPKGMRTIFPIIGGNFTGPRLSGTVLNLGADWGLTDSKGTFSADTRYHLQTNDGANIFIQTSGPTDVGLRIILESGSPAYYWVNNLIVVGKLSSAGPVRSDGSFLLRIDAWQLNSTIT